MIVKRWAMGDPPDFIQLQYQFTGHVRDSKRVPAPAGVADERMGVYREMVYNNVEGLIANNFPVLRGITPDDRWHALVRDYFSNHEAHTPLFPKISQEFLQFLDNERRSPDDPPFIVELAHYEEVEAALALDTRDIQLGDVDPDGNLLTELPVLSPLTRLLVYQYPVHRIGPEYQPEQPPQQPTYLVVFRDRNDNVGFMEMNPVTARLLEKIKGSVRESGRDMLESIAAEVQHPNPEVVVDTGLDIMERLRARDVLLGVRSLGKCQAPFP